MSSPPPTKKRRLNHNLATSDRMQVMVGIEKRKVEKLRQELQDANAAKDDALKEIGKLKSDKLSEIQSKNEQIGQLQEKLKTAYHDKEHTLQKENTLTHKIEILESQMNELQKENFKLRAQIYNNNKSSNNNDSNSAIIANGHPPQTDSANVAAEKSANYEMQCVQLQRDIKLKQVTIDSQNEEIMRLHSQLEQIENANQSNTDSLNKASKHIQRLQEQLKQRKANQSDLAQSEMADIRDSYDRKIRLLQTALNEYKQENETLKVVSEEYELCQSNYDALKLKYNALMEMNVKYEPIQAQLNEWKSIVRDLCFNLLCDDDKKKNKEEFVLDNEYDLKLNLENMNEKYILLIKEKDEYKSNLISVSSQLTERQKQLNTLKLSLQNEQKQRAEAVQKCERLQQQLNQAVNDSQSYKNILNTYNVMSPSKSTQQQQIQKLYQENERLNKQISELNQRIQQMEVAANNMNKRLEEVEMENVKLQSRIGDGEYNSLTTRVLSMKNNPLKLAMQRKQAAAHNEVKVLQQRLKELEAELVKYKSNVCGNGNAVNASSTSADSSVFNANYFELENKYNILAKKLELKTEEVEKLSKEIESAKKIRQRMNSLFAKKAGEYREKIYQMLGYNVTLLGDGKTYRLQHLWMDSPDDEIVLRIDKLEQLQVTDTEFVRNMDKTLLLKLHKTRSLPVFLSELTLHLYKDDS
eukprot:CAMPEP_0197052426 /NCGR_PEP_ID=MMETSP1384-20130603/26906_1 /TAXON_ID=29189 /ORGANISM="Ammonia sp." /LENGTH=696 /DNA_ID=CAMNT_0042485163 /DNA_START=15 /DNA_END=2105 /DNA_ORIENTATION=-